MASYNLGKVVGDDGVSLEYDWEGTSLGIKREDEAEYTYVDLKGDKGDTGSTGASGSDGYSPTVQTSKEGKTTTIEITDKNGTHTATIQDGADGTNGIDGTSPTASVSKSGNTATITITDKNGTTTTTVNDGTNGTNGRDGYIQYTAGSNISIDNNVISATDTTYSAGSNISISNGEISADLSSKQDVIQYSTMPTASSSNEGNIVQYIGANTNDYTNGYFYKCVSDEEETPTYSWENVEVQESSSGNEEIIFKYNDTANNLMSGQKVIDYYLLNNTLPFVRCFSYTTTNTTQLWEYIAIADKVDANSFTYVLYRYNSETSAYFGTPRYTYLGKLMIYFDNSHIATGITFPDYQTSKNGLLRSGRIALVYNNDLAYNSNQESRVLLNVCPSIKNTIAYSVDSDYNPAHKKYVDDSISSAIGSINTILATLTTPSNNGGN